MNKIFTGILIIGSMLISNVAQATFSNVNCADAGNLTTLGIPEIECTALEAIWDSTDGANWTDNTNWDVLTAANNWYGVSVVGGHVAYLMLNGNNLSGSLPIEIGDLNSLIILSSNQNSLSGGIPTTIGNLTELTWIQFGGNQLSGSIPSEIGNLTKLQYLQLQTNNLSGSIPVGIGNMVDLVELKLRDNNLTGNIPSSITSLTNLSDADFGDNQLSGSIPDFTVNTPSNYLQFFSNKFVFADFEAEHLDYNDGTPVNYYYSPQLVVDSNRIMSVTDGAVLTLTPEIAENPSGNDNYQWYKDSIIIVGATNRIYTKTAEVADDGHYTYTVTNSVVSGLTLQSHDAGEYIDVVVGVDVTSPVLTEILSVSTPTNDNTPDYTFNTDEAGTITYGGDCSSATSTATVGNNTITFNSLSEGVHNNCTISVTDSSANTSNVLSVTSFEVDNTMPDRFDGSPDGTQSSGTNSVEIYLNTWENATCRYSDTPNTVYADMAAMTNVTGGEDHGHDITGLVDGGSYIYYIRCTESSGNTNNVDFEIAFNITDETAPVITETTPVNTPTTDTTPNYIFNTDESGTITYSGDCSSSDTTATSGNNTITFNELSIGVHSNCTITVTDNSSNISNVLNVSSFTIEQSKTPIYRLYNTKTGVHLYTKGETDRDKILAKWSDFEFTDNTPAFYASLEAQDALTPIYRLYNTKTGVHLYTRGETDRDKILSKWSDFEFTDGGPVFYASLSDDGTTPIYRLYNRKTGVHLYTKGVADREKILNKWYDFEFTDGVPAFYMQTQ